MVFIFLPPVHFYQFLFAFILKISYFSFVATTNGTACYAPYVPFPVPSSLPALSPILQSPTFTSGPSPSAEVSPSFEIFPVPAPTEVEPAAGLTQVQVAATGGGYFFKFNFYS